MNYHESRKNPAVAALRAALQQSAGKRLELHDLEDSRGSAVRVAYGDQVSVLRPFWAGEGFRKDVDLARAAMRDAEVRPGDTAVVAARRLPAATRRQLDAEGVSWVDEHNGASIFAPPGLVVVLKRQSGAGPADAVLRWTEATGAVAEYVLSIHAERARTSDEPHVMPGVVEIADDLDLAPAIASRGLRMFDAEGWLRKTGPERGPGARRELLDPGRMLSSWAAWFREGRSVTIDTHRLIRTYEVFLDQELPRAWKDTWWLVTGIAAADRRAPYLTSVPQIDLYLDAAVFDDPAGMEDLLARAGLTVVESGARVRLHRADRFLRSLTRHLSNSHQVGDIRLYGDLLRAGGRAEDAAEHLRETRIGF